MVGGRVMLMLTYGYAYAHVKVYVRGWLTRKREK